MRHRIAVLFSRIASFSFDSYYGKKMKEIINAETKTRILREVRKEAFGYHLFSSRDYIFFLDICHHRNPCAHKAREANSV